MSANVATRLSSIAVVVILLTTVTIGTVESAPSNEYLSEELEDISYGQTSTLSEGPVFNACYSNVAHAPTKFGEIYASTAIGTWTAVWVGGDVWEYYYELSGIASFEGNRIFGAEIQINEGENPSAVTIYNTNDSNHTWSTNSSDGGRKLVEEVTSIIVGVAISTMGGHIDSAWTAASTIIDLLKAGADSLPESSEQGTNTISWDWTIGTDKTSQYTDFRVTVLPNETASITTEYSVYYGSTEADQKWLSTGVFEFEMNANDNPNNMSEQERLDKGITTVPRDQLIDRVAELNLSIPQVISLLNSDSDEFFFINSAPVCYSSSNVETTFQDLTTESESQAPLSDLEIVLMPTFNNEAQIMNIFGNNVSVQTSFDSIERDAVVLIDGGWAKSIDDEVLTNGLKDLIERGNAILLMSDSPDIISSENIGHSSAFVTDANIYGIQYNPLTNTTYCFSYIGEEGERPLSSAKSWIESHQNNVTPANSGSLNAPVLYSLTKVERGGLGEMNIETKYTKSSNTDGSVNLILTEYYLRGTPYPDSSLFENNKAIADMTISCEHENSKLLAYGPSFSSSSSTDHTVKISGSQSGVSCSGNWSYSIQECDTTVSVSGDSFTIHYDTDEYGSDKLNSKTVMPGTISLAQNEGYFCYQEIEYYSVNYLLDKAWSLEDTYTLDECTMTVSIL